MDRYNQLKVLLKNWEQEFFKTHQKKPSKVGLNGVELHQDGPSTSCFLYNTHNPATTQWFLARFSATRFISREKNNWT